MAPGGLFVLNQYSPLLGEISISCAPIIFPPLCFYQLQQEETVSALSISPSQRLQQDNQGPVAVQLPFISRHSLLGKPG